MKSVMIISLLSLLASCASTADKINERNMDVARRVAKFETDQKQVTDSPEKLKWFTVLETPQGTVRTQITKSIVQITPDIHCVFNKETKQGPFEADPGMRSKGANCILLTENFQLLTRCDKSNGIMVKAMVKEEKELDFKLSVQCELE